MTTAIRRRRGTTAQHSTFIGLEGELTVDTDKDTAVVHDGSTQGGRPLLREDLSNLPAGTIDNADINASAAIVDTKLATIATGGKVSNSATTATNANTASAIVARDASGNFTAGTITAALTGAASSNVLKAGDTMTGALVVPLASAATPSLTFTGDLNTGIYSPGADQLAVATNGTGRLFVDASGRIGVGTASPSGTLEVGSVSGAVTAGDLLVTTGSTTAGVTVGRLSSTSSDNTRFRVRNRIDTTLFDVTQGTLALGPVDNQITLSTLGAERARVDSSGRLGIGTSSPGSEFEIADTTGYVEQRFRRGSGTNDWAGIGLGATAFSFQTRDSTPISFATNATTRAVIDSSGNVGIGTTSPSHGKLTLFDPALAAFNALVIQQGNTLSTANDGLHIGIDSAVDAYITHKENRALAFGTANTERARIDASGRLLVGTSTNIRSSKLQVLSTGNDHQSLVGGNQIAQIELCRSSDSAGGAGLVANGNVIARIECLGNDGSAYRSAARIEAVVDGTPGASDMPGRLAFSTTADGASTPTERMRIRSDGRLLTFCSINSAIIGSTATAAGGSAGLFELNHSATSTTNGTNCFYVLTNGDVRNTNNSYGAISDIKLKENIVDASSQWDDLKALQVRNYNFKPETNQETHTQIGLVAQEVELVSPGLVGESTDRDAEGNDLGTVTKSVNYSVLYMKAVKALQEAMERIETLEQRLNDAGIN